MLRLYETGDADVVPNAVTFNSVLHNIAQSNDLHAPQKALRLLERMAQYHKAGMSEAKPDIILYNSLLTTFANSGRPESAQHAGDMLERLERMHKLGVGNTRPDVGSYNIVIGAWGQCGHVNRAVALLDRMTAGTDTANAEVKPDVTTYNTVLQAWSQSSERNAPVKALELLESMLRRHAGDERCAKPDVLSFSTVINAFSKSDFPRKARQTRVLLQQMKQHHVPRNVYVYGAVLNACAYTFGRGELKEEALKIAIETYEELQFCHGIETTHVVYGSFIRACRRLMRDDARRNRFISYAFWQCCSDGQLGEYVLLQLRAVPELYVALLQDYITREDEEVTYQDLPSNWTMKVRDRRKQRKGSTRARRRKNVRPSHIS